MSKLSFGNAFHNKYLIKYVHEWDDVTPTIPTFRTWGNKNVIDLQKTLCIRQTISFQHITFFQHIPTGSQVATELHCFRLSPQALFISNGRSRNILPLRHADGQNMQTMLRRLTVSVHSKCADRFPGQSWCVDFLTGLHFCTEWWIPWQYFRWRHKQTNIEITITFLLITLWCCLCYWVGM